MKILWWEVWGRPIPTHSWMLRISGVFRGALGHGPLWQKNFFFPIWKNRKTWFGPPFVWALVASKNLAPPPLWNPKYATSEDPYSNSQLNAEDYFQSRMLRIHIPTHSWMLRIPILVHSRSPRVHIQRNTVVSWGFTFQLMIEPQESTFWPIVELPSDNS